MFLNLVLLRVYKPLFLSLVALLLVSTNAQAEDWHVWRGPLRNGHSSENSGWKNGTWLAEKESWRFTAGQGSSSPVIAKGKVYLTGWKDSQDVLFCLDAISGKQLWKQQYKCPQYGRLSKGDKGIYSGPSSTPEYDPATQLLYTLSIDGDLICWNTQSKGKRAWGFNLHDKYAVQQRPKVGRSGHRDYGFTSSPLVVNDWLIIEVGAKQGSIIAFNKRTGKEVWRSKSQSPAGHTGGPVPMVVQSVPCLAVLNHDGLLVIRIDGNNAGKTVATYPWITDYSNNIAGVCVHQNSLLITSAYNQYKIARLDVTLKGVKLIWEAEHPSKVCTPVVHKGAVYCSWQKVTCLDFATGKLLWSGGKMGDPGSIILTADERLIVWGKRGTVLLAESRSRSPKDFKQLATKQLLKGSDAWPHIAFTNGYLYAKNRKGETVCIAVRP